MAIRLLGLEDEAALDAFLSQHQDSSMLLRSIVACFRARVPRRRVSRSVPGCVRRRTDRRCHGLQRGRVACGLHGRAALELHRGHRTELRRRNQSAHDSRSDARSRGSDDARRRLGQSGRLVCDDQRELRRSNEGGWLLRGQLQPRRRPLRRARGAANRRLDVHQGAPLRLRPEPYAAALPSSFPTYCAAQ